MGNFRNYDDFPSAGDGFFGRNLCRRMFRGAGMNSVVSFLSLVLRGFEGVIFYITGNNTFAFM